MKDKGDFVFSPWVVNSLREAGWYEGRHVHMHEKKNALDFFEKIKQSIRSKKNLSIPDGVFMNNESVRILSNIGGLTIVPPKIEKTEYAQMVISFFPEDAFKLLSRAVCLELKSRHISPLGTFDGGTCGLFVDDNGFAYSYSIHASDSLDPLNLKFDIVFPAMLMGAKWWT